MMCLCSERMLGPYYGPNMHSPQSHELWHASAAAAADETIAASDLVSYVSEDVSQTPELRVAKLMEPAS